MPEISGATEKKTFSREDLATYLEKGDFSEAEEAIHALLEKSPDDAGLLNSLGSIYAQRGDNFNAESTFRKAVELRPDLGDVYYNLGLVYSKQSRKTEAVEQFLKALAVNPGDFAAHNDLGVLYHSLGKTLLARSHFIKALEANILYKRALVNLFEVCWDADSYSEGLAWVEKYINATAPEFEHAVIEPEQTETAGPVDIETVEHKEEKEESPSPGVLKFIKKSSPEGDDIFLKHVPAELREKKTGVNIAIVGDSNIAGQLSLLFRMINRYTVHKARLIISQEDYFSCDRDLVLSPDGQEGHGEALEIIEHADFFHMGRIPRGTGGVNWENYLTPCNALIQHFHSEIGIDAAQMYKWHTENRIKGLYCGDLNMPGSEPLFHHVNYMCDFSRIKPCSPPSEMVRICHVPGNRHCEETDLLLSAVKALKEKGYPVDLELIEGKTNEECLDIKSRCHITFDQISAGAYGLSAIESMAAGHAVLSGVSNFVSSLHPDNPVVYVTGENIYDRLEILLLNKNEITRIGNAGKFWVWNNHDPMKVTRQYVWIYDLVMNGHGIVDDRDKYLLK